MENFSRDQMDTLLNKREGWLASLYMPTVKAGKEVQQNPTRFKNLVRQIEESLKDSDSKDLNETLDKARALYEDFTFWNNQGEGLAAFFSSEDLHLFELPGSPQERVEMTKDYFYLKPLVPYLSGEGEFYLLALSKKEPLLYKGNRSDLEKVEVDSLPKNLKDALRNEKYQKQFQSHTSGPQGASMVHGHGGATDKEKDQVLRYFREIDKGLKEFLKGKTNPLVLAGVEYFFPLYEEANTYNHFVEGGVKGHPGQKSTEELHQEAWEIVEPIFNEKREKAWERFQNLRGTGKALEDLMEVVSASYKGKVQSLFVDSKKDKSGGYNIENDIVKVEEEGRDLLDLATIQTLQNGGEVFHWDSDEVENEPLAGAVLRYE